MFILKDYFVTLITHSVFSPRAWWQFAGARVRDANRRRLSWKDKTTVLTHVRHLNAYCRAYQLRLEAHVRQTESDQSATTTTRFVCGEKVYLKPDYEYKFQFVLHTIALTLLLKSLFVSLRLLLVLLGRPIVSALLSCDKSSRALSSTMKYTFLLLE